MASTTTGQGSDAPTTKYAHNALGQRVFKTEPLFSSAATTGTGKNLLADGEEGEAQGQQPGLIQQILNFWSKLWSPSTSDAEKQGWSYVYAEDGSLLSEYGSGGSPSSGTCFCRLQIDLSQRHGLRVHSLSCGASSSCGSSAARQFRRGCGGQPT